MMQWDDPDSRSDADLELDSEHEPSLDDAPLDGSDADHTLVHVPTPSRGGEPPTPSHRSGPSPLVIVLLFLVAAGLGVGAWWYLSQDAETPPAPAPSQQATSASDPALPPGVTGDPVEVEEQLDLPPLSASDAFLRDITRRLSEHPRLVTWLANEDLVRRFVAAVDAVARGESPSDHVEFMRPEEPFDVEQLPDGRWVVAETNDTRWDPVFEVLDTIDPDVAAKLYRQLEPLFEEAYAEIGRPGTTFRQRMNEAIARIEAVEYPEGPLVVTAQDGNWVYVDEELENASAVEKQLWRLGKERREGLQQLSESIRPGH